MSKKEAKNVKTNKKLIIKICIIVTLCALFLILGFLIYKNLFSSSNNTRYDGIEEHSLTKAEINSVKEKINSIEHVKSIDIYTKSKIIRIFVKLDQDVDFKLVKNTSNSCLEGFKEENLQYYDVEIFFESSNKESDIYPQIGYKHKSQLEFSW